MPQVQYIWIHDYGTYMFVNHWLWMACGRMRLDGLRMLLTMRDCCEPSLDIRDREPTEKDQAPSQVYRIEDGIVLQ